MDAQQRSFLVEARRYALKKADSEEPQELCKIDIKINRLSSVSENTKERIAEELSEQGYIQLEKRGNQKIKKLTFTEMGLLALKESLGNAGKATNSVNFDISPLVLEEINKLIETIQKTNIENRDSILEVAEALSKEVNSAQPKKSVIALLFNALLGVTSLSSNLTTIAGAAGLDLSSIPSYISSVFK